MTLQKEHMLFKHSTAQAAGVIGRDAVIQDGQRSPRRQRAGKRETPTETQQRSQQGATHGRRSSGFRKMNMAPLVTRSSVAMPLKRRLKELTGSPLELRWVSTCRISNPVLLASCKC